MIDVTEKGDGIIPLYRGTQLKPLPEHGFSAIVTGPMHDYFKRELGRAMDSFEIKVLQDMLQQLKGANRKLAKVGKHELIHSPDDLMTVFVERARAHEAAAVTKKIMVGYTGGRRDG